MKNVFFINLIAFMVLVPSVVSAQHFLLSDIYNKETGRYICYERGQLPDYSGTDVHHLVSLPDNYRKNKKFPVIFELTGNKWTYGSGEIEDAHMGVSMSLHKDFIVVVVPYVNEAGTSNEVTWWGDEKKTVEYLKKLVKKVCSEYSADKNNLFLCGFSRGAIGVSYIGLYDDEIASVWKGFISFNHFDGFKSWATDWGLPLEKYRASAVTRLKRIGGRPWYVSYSGKRGDDSYRTMISEMGVAECGDFEYAPVQLSLSFKKIPNEYFQRLNNDIWPAFDIPDSEKMRSWLYKVVKNK